VRRRRRSLIRRFSPHHEVYDDGSPEQIEERGAQTPAIDMFGFVGATAGLRMAKLGKVQRNRPWMATRETKIDETVGIPNLNNCDERRWTSRIVTDHSKDAHRDRALPVWAGTSDSTVEWKGSAQRNQNKNERGDE
jgi:hypothetical protein